MSEKEILDKIEKSAAQEKIPESIEPEQIKRKLKENQKNKVKRRSGITYYGAVAAAALVLVIGAAGGIHAVTGGGTGLMTAPVGIEKAASGQKSDEGWSDCRRREKCTKKRCRIFVYSRKKLWRGL